MTLRIETTGWDTWLDGSGNVKMLITGKGGSGKTVFSSTSDRPIFANCEDGLASIADRGTPFVNIRRSQDMLDLLSYLKGLEVKPKQQREYATVVIDTLDAYQRKLMDEWIMKNRASEFKGYEAYGWLATQMSMLMTRLLNLDYSVIVQVHFRDKTVREQDGTEVREYEFQLAGAFKDTIVNDFDLVGMIDTYFEADPEKGRVERRGITFKSSPKRPFLKDRFGVMPDFLPINFDANDWGQLKDCFFDTATKRELPEVQVVGEVPPADSKPPTVPDLATVGGPLPEQAPVGQRLSDLKKPELMVIAKDLGLNPKQNLLKGELIVLIEEEEAKTAAVLSEAVSDLTDDAVKTLTEEKETPVADTKKESPEQAMPVEQFAHEMNAEIISDTRPPKPKLEPVPEVKQDVLAPTVASADVCEDCGTDLAELRSDIPKLSFIKFRRRLCAVCFTAAKAAAK